MKVVDFCLKRLWICSLAVLGVLPGSTHAPAVAAEFPDHPISLVVPFAPGGPVDVIARAVADGMSKEIDGTVVIENKPGAGGAIAFSYVGRAKPDGYTLVAVDMSFVVLSHFHDNVGYDPVKDFKMVGQTTLSTLVLVVPADSTTPDLQSFVEHARQAGEGVSIGNAGLGSTPHLAGLSFAKVAKIKPLMVPYRGMTPAITDLLAGRISSAFVAPPGAVGLVKEGKLKMLATIGRERLKEAPDVPTFAEKGLDLPGFGRGTWYGLAAPAGTPAAIVDKLNAALNRALDRPDLQKRLESIGVYVQKTSPSEFDGFIRDQVAQWNGIAAAVKADAKP
ncbi:MAG: tripartite tricarboxylate transporter substrate binding protein [Proteobacteria bacterium]|nr:tripartite tricarboxylate transporter substrate binding protein [Pseudomonadota bacterium]